MVLMPEIPLPGSRLKVAAKASQRIAESIPERERATEIQRCLRAYRPAWDLVLDPRVLDLLLEAERQGIAHWWRPARLALFALAAWLDLPGPPEVEKWLVDEVLTSDWALILSVNHQRLSSTLRVC